MNQLASASSGRAACGTQQPGRPDDFAAIQNAHELRERQFGIRMGRVEISSELCLGGSHRIENCRKFVVHTHITSCPRRNKTRDGAFGFSAAAMARDPVA